jgi:hypothetical protein
MRGSRHRAARVSIGLQSPQERRPQIEVFRRDQDRDGGLGRVRSKFAEILADELEITVDAIRKLRDEAKLLGLKASVLRDQQPRALGGQVGQQGFRLFDAEFFEILSGTERVRGQRGL